MQNNYLNNINYRNINNNNCNNKIIKKNNKNYNKKSIKEIKKNTIKSLNEVEYFLNNFSKFFKYAKIYKLIIK